MPNIFPSGTCNVEKSNALKFFEGKANSAKSEPESLDYPSVFVANKKSDLITVYDSLHTNCVTLKLNETLVTVRIDHQWREVSTNKSSPYITADTYFAPTTYAALNSIKRRSYSEESIISTKLVALFSEKTQSVFNNIRSITNDQVRYVPHFHISITLLADGGEIYEAAVCAVNFIALVHCIPSPFNQTETFYLSGDDASRASSDDAGLKRIAAKLPFAMTICTKFVKDTYVNVIFADQTMHEISDCRTILLLSTEGIIDVAKYGGLEYNIDFYEDALTETTEIRDELAAELAKAAHSRLQRIKKENKERTTGKTK